jgi:hypothetical protein
MENFVYWLIPIYAGFIGNYINERIKNSALKKDIGDLTRIVESVKNDYTIEQAFLKKDLDRLLSNEVSYRSEEKNAIIEFHGLINQWLYEISEFSFYKFSKNNIEALKDKINLIDSYFTKVSISKSKIELIVIDQNIIVLANSVFIGSLTFHHWAGDIFFDFKNDIDELLFLENKFPKELTDHSDQSTFSIGIRSKAEEISKNHEILSGKFFTERNSKFLEVTKILIEFQKLVKIYLRT